MFTFSFVRCEFNCVLYTEARVVTWLTIEGAQWSQSFQISNQSLVRFSSWNTGSWDDHNWRVRFLTRAQFLYNPGPTHIQSDISYGRRQLQLLFASDFGVWPSAAYQVSISIQVWASLACGGSRVWVMWERGPCWWLWDTDAPWQSSTSQDADNKQWELKLSQTRFEFLLIKSSTRRSYLV